MIKKGQVFNYKYKGIDLYFTVTRAWQKAFRVVINDTHYAIWIPNQYVSPDGTLRNIDWKLRTPLVRHLFDLMKIKF